ncbi:MAG: diguanylate cyclase [Sulfuricellaceae bacterium]|nr:diguanylate cyclase [Sulfuricellaceae bacterium]
MINVTHEELERILKTLEEALALHEKWRDNLHRTLACQLPPSAADMAEDAHHQCAFGHWFYSKGNAHLLNLPAFRIIGELHQEMHGGAREICRRLDVMGKVPVKNYDDFIAQMMKFREELIGMQHKVSYTLQNIDPLTGAYQTSRLLPDLKAEQEKLKQSGNAYSLLLMDIDLKTINQNRGRHAGDKILQTAILSIRETLGDGDKIYRYGGAEFVICLPGKDVKDAEIVRETLMKKIGEALSELAGETPEALHIHYGVVELDYNAYLEELLDQSARSTYTINI